MSPKMPKPPEPPASPPPPTAVAETVEKADAGGAPKPKRRGVAALTKRRLSVGTGTTGQSGIDTSNY